MKYRKDFVIRCILIYRKPMNVNFCSPKLRAVTDHVRLISFEPRKTFILENFQTNQVLLVLSFVNEYVSQANFSVVEQS